MNNDPNIVERSYKCSPFVNCYSHNDVFCLYDRAKVQLVYGNEEMIKLFYAFRNTEAIEDVLKEFPFPKREAIKILISELIAKEILVPVEVKKDDIINRIVTENKITTPQIDNIFLYLTEKCNYDCRYCYVRNNVGKPTNMAKEVADRFIQLLPVFVEKSRSKKVYIVFYGGEPLLNFDVLKRVINGVGDLEHCGMLGGKSAEFRLVTNGSLVTEDMAQYLAQHKVGTAVSIDGPKEIHDEMRVFRSGRGTFLDTIHGYDILKKYGMSEISLAIWTHNYEHLRDVTQYLVEELDARAIRFNIPEGFIKNMASFNNDFFEVLARNLVEAFDFLVETGISSTNIGIEAFVASKPKFYPCNGCGKRLAISPDGYVSPCESFLSGRRHLLGNILDLQFSIYDNIAFNKWLRRSGYLMEECRQCEALGICGGGCAYNAEVFNGGFFKPDITICNFAKKMLDYLIWKPVPEGGVRMSKNSPYISMLK